VSPLSTMTFLSVEKLKKNVISLYPKMRQISEVIKCGSVAVLWSVCGPACPGVSRRILAFAGPLLSCANLAKLISVMTHGTQLSDKIFARQKFRPNLEPPGLILFSSVPVCFRGSPYPCIPGPVSGHHQSVLFENRARALGPMLL